MKEVYFRQNRLKFDLDFGGRIFERLGVLIFVRFRGSVWTEHLNAWIFNRSKIRPVPCAPNLIFELSKSRNIYKTEYSLLGIHRTGVVLGKLWGGGGMGAACLVSDLAAKSSGVEKLGPDYLRSFIPKPQGH